MNIAGHSHEEASNILTAFGYMATTITINADDWDDADFNICASLSSLANKDERFELQNLNLICSHLSLGRLSTAALTNLRIVFSRLKRISFMNCEFNYFSHMFLMTASSVAAIQFIGCLFDENTVTLFDVPDGYSQLREMVLATSGWPTRIVNRLLPRCPQLTELSLYSRDLNVRRMGGIATLMNLLKLDIFTGQLFPRINRLSNLRRLRIMNPNLPNQHQLTLRKPKTQKHITELFYLDSNDEKYNPEATRFKYSQVGNTDLDFDNLRKFVLRSNGNFSNLHYILPHMKKMELFAFWGTAGLFNSGTFDVLLNSTPVLQRINIIVDGLPPLDDVIRLSDESTEEAARVRAH